MVTAPATGEMVVVYRDPARTQSLDLVENDSLPANNLEAQFDYVTMLVQRVSDLIVRSLRQPDGDSTSVAVLPSKVDRASLFLGFDASGDPVAIAAFTSDPGSSTVTAFMATVLDDTTAANARATLGAVALAGDTMTGNLAISTTSNPKLIINTSSGSNKRTFIDFESAGTTQYLMGVDYGIANVRDFFIYDSIGLAKRLGIDSNGVVEITAGQLKFPATQNPSSDVNTLDDYEEFTWTPSVGGNATYTSREGTGVKIGKRVYLHCEMVINVIGTGSTSVISGIPAAYAHATTVPAYGSVGSVYAQSLSQNVVDIKARVASGGTTAIMECLTAAGASHSAAAVIGNGTVISFDINYFAAG